MSEPVVVRNSFINPISELMFCTTEMNKVIAFTSNKEAADLPKLNAGPVQIDFSAFENPEDSLTTEEEGKEGGKMKLAKASRKKKNPF